MSTELDSQSQEKRPTLLLVLAILSLISIGFAILMNLGSLAGGPFNEDDLNQQRLELAKSKSDLREAGMTGFVNFFDQLQGMIEETNENFYLSKGIMLVTDIVGLVGVIFMMRRRKIGFHLYIVYSLLALGGMYLYISPQNIHISLPIINAIFAGLFIFLYSRTVYWMR